MENELETIIVDGSNVIRSRRRPDIRNLAKLLKKLEEEERDYTVVVDASVRHDFGHLFELPPELKKRLTEEDGIPKPVKEKFKRKGATLSDDAEIRKKSPREWRISDREREYSIRSWRDRDDHEHLDAYDLKSKERIHFERMLEDESITQAPAGTPADQIILRYARDHPDSQILTNDQYHDYVEDYPFVKDEGRFIRFTIMDDEPLLIEPEGAEVKEAPGGVKESPAKEVAPEPSEEVAEPKPLGEPSAEEAAPEPSEEVTEPKPLRAEVLPQPFEGETVIPERASIILTGGGQAILWGALLWMGFPAMTLGAPTMLSEFASHFLTFLFIAITGVVLTKWGVGETRNRELLDEALKYSVVAILACTALSLGLGSRGGTMGMHFLTKITYAITAAVLAAVTYKIARSRKIYTGY